MLSIQFMVTVCPWWAVGFSVGVQFTSALTSLLPKGDTFMLVGMSVVESSTCR